LTGNTLENQDSPVSHFVVLQVLKDGVDGLSTLVLVRLDGGLDAVVCSKS
jgi:hypothetical protein